MRGLFDDKWWEFFISIFRKVLMRLCSGVILGSLAVGVLGVNKVCEAEIEKQSAILWKTVKTVVEPTIEYRKTMQPGYLNERVVGWDELLPDAEASVNKACNGNAGDWLAPITKHIDSVRGSNVDQAKRPKSQEPGEVIARPMIRGNSNLDNSFEKRAGSVFTNFAKSLIDVNSAAYTGPLRASQIETSCVKLKSDVDALIGGNQISDTVINGLRQIEKKQIHRAKLAAAGFRKAKRELPYEQAIAQAMAILIPMAQIVADSLPRGFDPSVVAKRLVDNNRILMPAPWERDEECGIELRKRITELLP